MRWREWFEKDILPFFNFSRQERNGAIFLLIILNFTWILPVFVSDDKEKISATESSALDSAFRLLENNAENASAGKQQLHPRGGNLQEKTEYPKDRFRGFGPVTLNKSFDPNKATEDQWSSCGLPSWMIRNIQRYQEKGGKFRKPEDLLRIYGMDTGHFKQISPLIEIQNNGQAPKGNLDHGNAYLKMKRVQPPASINVNLADSTSWESLPGIGPVLASRIIRFRERLGGFVSIDQVREVYGIPDSTFHLIRSRLVIDPHPGFVPLRINVADADLLSDHPYLTRKISGLLVAYRKQHGPFHQAEDLLAIPLVDSALLKRIAPYLSFN